MRAGSKENSEPYSIVVTEQYYDNLKQIVLYALKQKQPLNALKVAEGINKTMRKIDKNPLIYAEC